MAGRSGKAPIISPLDTQKHPLEGFLGLIDTLPPTIYFIASKTFKIVLYFFIILLLLLICRLGLG